MQNTTSLLNGRPQLLLQPSQHALRRRAAFRTIRRQKSTCIRADLTDSSPALIDTFTSSVQTTADALSVDPTVLAAGIGAIGGPAMHRTHADTFQLIVCGVRSPADVWCMLDSGYSRCFERAGRQRSPAPSTSTQLHARRSGWRNRLGRQRGTEGAGAGRCCNQRDDVTS